MRDDAFRESGNLRDFVNIISSGTNGLDNLIVPNVSVNGFFGVFGLGCNSGGEMSLEIEGNNLFLVGNSSR